MGRDYKSVVSVNGTNADDTTLHKFLRYGFFIYIRKGVILEPLFTDNKAYSDHNFVFRNVLFDL